MDIKCKLIKELEDGSAIVSLELDEEAKDWLIGEGFTVVLKEAIAISKTYLKKLPSDKKPKVGKIVPKKGKEKAK